jgi:hypothetical protein
VVGSNPSCSLIWIASVSFNNISLTNVSFATSKINSELFIPTLGTDQSVSAKVA